jgi:RHS repeat-associated protein
MIEKYGTGATTLIVYDEAGHLVGEYSSTGALVQETIWMGDTPIATLRPNGSSISTYYVHTDQLNAPRVITQPSTNTVAWRWDTDPFGTAAPNQNPASLGTFIYNLRFPGQYYQAETGLNYNYFRDYDPAVGRYIESDPIGLLGGINTYAYVDDDPVSGSDPLGLVQYDKPNPNIGTIICNGSGGIDVQFPANISPMAEKCLGDCLRAHEISHISDIRRLGPGACKGQARGVIPTFDTQAQLLASVTKRDKQPLRARYPVSDVFVEKPVQLESKASISGIVELSGRFGDLSTALSKDDLLVFWFYEPKDAKRVELGQYGGWLLVPKTKKN